MQLLKDIWRPLVVGAPLEDIHAAGSLDGFDLHWLPVGPRLTYRADPFGLWRDGFLFVFVEQFDYRTAHGVIDLIVLDDRLRLVETRTVLREDWHLSYPFILTWNDAIWMLPEACMSGTSYIYRAIEFPWRWERFQRIDLDVPPIDATPCEFDGKWWMFYAPATRPSHRLTQLCLASAETPLGPWTPHPANPVYENASGSRPGGTPFLKDDKLVLPVQDCSRGYGSSLAFLAIEELSQNTFVAARGNAIAPPSAAAPFEHGCHTLSSAGHVTLLDVKQQQFSLEALVAGARRKVARA